MATPTYPLRVRLYRGRDFHAARAIPNGDAEFTACGQTVCHRDERLDGTTPITCRTCYRETKADRATEK
jgi:hypothetical protein